MRPSPSGPDHGGDSKLAGDDGGVTRPAAAVGDDGGRRLHHGFPVGGRGVSDEDVTVLEGVQVARPGDHVGGSRGDLGAHRPARHQRGPRAVKAYSSRTCAVFCETTVSGRAWTM